jgi:Flp pilus assembly protein TadD/ketosteroid isomerase-like protein
MKNARSTIFATLRILTLATACAATSAYADEYGDVSQLLRASKFPEAMAKADAHLSAKPSDPQMRFLKGVIQRNSGKQADAIVTFTKLTEDYPELPEPYNNLAVLYASQSQFDKARAALEMAIRTNPSYATAHENLGDVYARLASEAYNKALNLDGANPAVQPKLALIRELFKPGGKGQNQTTVTASAAPAAAAPAATPAPGPAAVAPRVAATPVPTPTPDPVKAAVSDNTEKEVAAAVRKWAKAWSDQDINTYIGSYSKDYKGASKQSRKAWEQERRDRIVGKPNISVKLENLDVSVDANKAVAKFRQDYRGGSLEVTSRKTLELVKAGERWVIVRESTGN